MRERISSLWWGTMLAWCGATVSFAQEPLRARFFDEPPADAPAEGAGPPPPSREGKEPWVADAAPQDQRAPWADSPLLPGPDVFVSDGAETGLAINLTNASNLVAVHNVAFLGTSAQSTSANGNVSWTPRTFPVASGSYNFFPFDPWAVTGNVGGELYSLLIWRHNANSNSRCLIARSPDSGVTWTAFFERALDTGQDRAMMDIDRTTALGGGAGSAHDGRMYLCYDDWGVNFSTYTASRIVITNSASAGGGMFGEIAVSTAGFFNGSQMQPVAGTVDGQVHIMAVSQAGSTRFLSFHELAGAGTGALTRNKSTIASTFAGQNLGGSGRFGVNGHRIDAHGMMDIDRTLGPRRGFLYVCNDRNANPANTALDQGDVYLSVSTNGALSWVSTLVPGQAPGKTQFFSTLDVDDNGWIHLVYYQNESGNVNNGVLNAGTANAYYTRSMDGGTTWTSHALVNLPANSLDYFQPPPNLAAQNYYLIGDYNAIRATGTGSNTTAYALWSGYDKDRSDAAINDKRDRVLCTTVLSPGASCPVASAPRQETILNGAGATVMSVKNRFLSFSADVAATTQAARVKFVSLPGAFNVFNGTTAWVQTPQAVSELPGKGLSDAPGADPTFQAARLGASPVYADWSSFGVVHVFDERIVPSRQLPAQPLEAAVYDVQLVSVSCDANLEASFSATLTITNARWGDVAALQAGVFRAPDGSIDVTADVLAVLAKFSNAPGAPIKARAEMVGSGPTGPQAALTGKIEINDVLAVLGAFSGGSYSFPPPAS